LTQQTNKQATYTVTKSTHESRHIITHTGLTGDEK